MERERELVIEVKNKNKNENKNKNKDHIWGRIVIVEGDHTLDSTR
jgi:hypothetical protein